MTALLARVLGRLPIGWLQLSHSRTRMLTAIAGVTFANILVFVQLGVLGALNGSTVAPYQLFNADIIISSKDSNTLSDGSNIARQIMFQSLGVAGVADATPLYTSQIEWQLPDSSSATLQVYAIDPEHGSFVQLQNNTAVEALLLENTAFIDSRTRGVSEEIFDSLSSGVGAPLVLELNGLSISAIDLLSIGSGFTADGTLFVSDQTFLRLFPKRVAGAPDHILLHTADSLSSEVIVERLRATLPEEVVKINTWADAINANLAYQTTQRPTGIIFGFGVFIGILVGIVIVYQVLATDVANHLREYATFKAIGYPQSFFRSIVFEEAFILATLGFFPGCLIAMGIYAGLVSATGLPVAMDATRALTVFLGTLAACSISGAFAARRLAAADPADLF